MARKIPAAKRVIDARNRAEGKRKMGNLRIEGNVDSIEQIDDAIAFLEDKKRELIEELEREECEEDGDEDGKFFELPPTGGFKYVLNMDDINGEILRKVFVESGDDEPEKISAREFVLREAVRCVTEDRNDQYGEPEDNFQLAADMWNAKTGHDFTAEDVALFMANLKIARIETGRFKMDSYVDAIGYLACAAEIASRHD